AQRIAASYLQRANDPMLNTRVQLYNRLWPFGRVITLLANIHSRSDKWAADFLQNLKACIDTYSRPQSAPQSTYNDAEEWVSSLLEGWKVEVWKVTKFNLQPSNLPTFNPIGQRTLIMGIINVT